MKFIMWISFTGSWGFWELWARDTGCVIWNMRKGMWSTRYGIERWNVRDKMKNMSYEHSVWGYKMWDKVHGMRDENVSCALDMW